MAVVVDSLKRIRATKATLAPKVKIPKELD